MTETMSLIVNKVEGLQVTVPYWEMEDLFEPVSLPSTVPESSLCSHSYTGIKVNPQLPPAVTFSVSIQNPSIQATGPYLQLRFQQPGRQTMEQIVRAP